MNVDYLIGYGFGMLLGFTVGLQAGLSWRDRKDKHQ